MTTVRGFLQLLNGKANGQQYKEYYDLMIQELDRANSIITEYLAMAKDRLVNCNKKALPDRYTYRPGNALSVNRNLMAYFKA